MNLNEEVELLKGVPIFAKIEPAKLKLLAFTSERMNFADGPGALPSGRPGRCHVRHPGRRGRRADRHAERARSASPR